MGIMCAHKMLTSCDGIDKKMMAYTGRCDIDLYNVAEAEEETISRISLSRNGQCRLCREK